jgi:hypothetical protein
MPASKEIGNETNLWAESKDIWYLQAADMGVDNHLRVLPMT